jgi:hypothetical protein
MDSSRCVPESARSDSHVLVPFKKYLTGKLFVVVINVKKAVTSLLQKLDTDLHDGIQNLGFAVEKIITT